MGLDTLFILFISFIVHLSVLYILALQSSFQTLDTDNADRIPPWLIRTVGIISALFTLATPLKIEDPLWQCEIRNITFFYACKLLDLTLTGAENPPARLIRNPHGSGSDKKDERVPAPILTIRDRAIYVWLLLTETRYHSFSNEVTQTHRAPPLADTSISARLKLFLTWQDVLPALLIPTLVFLYPNPWTKAAFLILQMHLGLEALHTLLHPRCPYPLFYRPWAASSLADFWTSRWHTFSAFLRTLAYKPTRRVLEPIIGKDSARAIAVLATFSLSGVWHAWAVSPLLYHPWRGAALMWAWFMLQGVWSLVESVVWPKGAEGGMVQRVMMWTVVLGSGGLLYRWLECDTNLVWMRGQGC